MSQLFVLAHPEGHSYAGSHIQTKLFNGVRHVLIGFVGSGFTVTALGHLCARRECGLYGAGLENDGGATHWFVAASK